MASNYKLTYFPVKALAEPTRMLFKYAGIEFDDCRIEKENWPEYKTSKIYIDLISSEQILKFKYARLLNSWRGIVKSD